MGYTVDVPNGSANPRTATAMVAFNPADGSTVGGGYTSVVNVTRPGNTTPYDALDVVGATEAALTFENIGPAGGHIFITDVDLRIDINAVTSGMAAWRLHLYSATPGSGLDDNAAFNLAAGDRATYLGYIDLPVPVDMGDTIFSQPAPQVPAAHRVPGRGPVERGASCRHLHNAFRQGVGLGVAQENGDSRGRIVRAFVGGVACGTQPEFTASALRNPSRVTLLFVFGGGHFNLTQTFRLRRPAIAGTAGNFNRSGRGFEVQNRRLCILLGWHFIAHGLHEVAPFIPAQFDIIAESDMGGQRRVALDRKEVIVQFGMWDAEKVAPHFCERYFRCGRFP